MHSLHPRTNSKNTTTGKKKEKRKEKLLEMDLEKSPASNPSGTKIQDRTLTCACMLTMLKQSTPNQKIPATTEAPAPADFSKLTISTVSPPASSDDDDDHKPPSPCSMTDTPGSLPRTPPPVADTPPDPPKLGHVVCKGCNSALDRASSCCGTYAVELWIRVEDIPKAYRPRVTGSGTIQANFPSFAKANRYRKFLAHQMRKKRKLRFLVNFDPDQAEDRRKRQRNDEIEAVLPSTAERQTGYAPSNLMPALSHMSSLPDPWQHPASLGLRNRISDMPQTEALRAHANMLMHDYFFQRQFG